MTTDQLEQLKAADFSTEPLIQNAAAPGALLVDVRAGRHKNFDRLVFEFQGPRPGHQVRYVTQLIQDGSGEPVPLRGRAVVEIVMQPAAAHDEDGNPTFTGPPPDVHDFAVFRQVADAGDFEGVLTWGIGTAATTGLHVLGLANPSRIAVDVQHAAPGTGNQLLRRGDRSAAVATWQWRLFLALGRDLRVDEDFGPVTEQATKDFQHAHHLSADGVVGPRSRAAMETALGL
jgi:peptidoglycan hydrolase-like protein with peptidoglycan-binding domain